MYLGYGPTESFGRLKASWRRSRLNSRHLSEYCAKCGGDLQMVRAAVRRVFSLRNQAGHQGCLGFELANQIRSDWLGQSRPGEGIFQAILPGGLLPS